MAERRLPAASAAGLDASDAALLGRYVDAFERYDVDLLVELLHDDATLSMPPFALWIRGIRDIGRWWRTEGRVCRGSRVVPVAANGAPSFAQYRRAGPGGTFEAFAIHVLDVTGGKVRAIDCFIDATLFEQFGLPLRL